MAHKVLFLGGGSRFMMSIVVTNLERAGYEVLSIQPDLGSIDEYQNDTDIVIVFLAPTVLERISVLQRLRDLCSGRKKSLFLIGDTDELWACRNIIPNSAITAVFEKPVDVKMLIYAVDNVSRVVEIQKRKTILLVDDDADYLKLVNSWLSRKYNVALVSSGMQALTYLANNKPDLILLDYSMPVVGGPQVLEMIRSEPDTEDIPVIFLTGKDDRESVMNGLRLDPAGYILKTIDKHALLARLADFFHQLGAEDTEDEEEEEDTEDTQEAEDAEVPEESKPAEDPEPSDFSELSEFSGSTKPSEEPKPSEESEPTESTKPPEPSSAPDPFDNLLSW